VIVVADGCGGMTQGDTASRLAVEAIQEQIQRSGAAGPALRSAILDGMEAANHAVCELSGSAGTTLAVVEIDGSMMRTYHVGDSTILVTGNRGRVKLLTTDHSPVGYAVQAGVLDAHDAIYHEDRHLISNVIGCPDAHIEIGARRKLSSRDTVVVGSDGLFDNLRVAEIVEIARKGPLADCAKRLAALATQRMIDPDADEPSKPDDLTFVLFRPY
jgi:serine/threonine protein phosphatase PrpC